MGPGRLVLKGGETLGGGVTKKRKKKAAKEVEEQEEGSPGQEVAGARAGCLRVAWCHSQKGFIKSLSLLCFTLQIPISQNQ
jgi:hypothetical protein